jgi:hypothetical protein
MIEVGNLNAILICILVFFLFFALLFLRVYKKRPDLLIPSRLQLNENEINSTLDVNFISGIGFTAWGFAEGAYLLCNLVLWLFYNKIYLDITSLIPLTIVYTIFLANAFYGFMIKYR